MRAWIVGQNETPILGEGWYGRSHDWYGLPFRESFGRCSLRLPPIPGRTRLTLVLGSALCQHCPSQMLIVRCGDREWSFELRPQPSGYGWQNVEIDLEDLCPEGGPLEIVLEPQKWRHGDYEDVQDFREVGILLGAVMLRE
ncbi:MAG: hypothetical protein KC964_02655 [Candidatus Omnitrophica bacterium]|nr:hypothetical protein [Candidatus Omnitrophota bacterium]